MADSRFGFLFRSTVLMLALLSLSVVASYAAPITYVIINELDSDQVGTDAGEFVELYDGGVGNTSLDDFVLVFFNGSNDQSYASFDLDGYSTDANGYFVIGNAGVPNVGLTFAGNFLQNGQDAVALYLADGTDFPNGTDVTTTNLIDALVYDTADADDLGLLVLLNAGQPQVDEDANGSATTQSIGRCPNGAGGELNTSTYTTGAPTPGAANDCPAPPDILINELDSDQVGTDSAEFVELYDGGVGNSLLDGYVLVFFNGANDLSYASYDLDGYSTDANGYFVIGNVVGANAPLSPATDAIQDGQDAVALYLANDTDFPNGTPVTTTNLIDALVYDTSDADDPGLLVLLNAGEPQINEDGNGAGTTESIGRCPDGAGGLRNTSSHTTGAPTPGAANDCPVPAVLINELDSDQVGTDAGEFIELYDGGVGNTSLDGYVLVFFNGSNDQSYASYDLDGYSTNANGYFVVGNAGVPNVGLTFAGNFLQNGQDAVALYMANGSDFPNGTPVTTTNLIDALVYDTADADDPGLLVLLNAGQPQIDEDANGAAVTESIGRCPDGAGGARNTSTYLTGAPTPGAANDCPPIGPSVTSSTPNNLASNVPVDINPITVTFSEAVTVDLDDFALACAASGAQTLVVLNYDMGTSTASLTLASNLPPGELCTLTIDNDDAGDDSNDGVKNTSNQYLIGNNIIRFVTAGAGVCVPTNLISTIQGTGATSPFVDTFQTIQGVVVGDFQTGAKLSMFFVQEEEIDSDGLPQTSEGIAVFDTASPTVDVSVGDIVCVSGTVVEFASESGSLTELTDVMVSIVSSGNTLPAAVPLTLPFPDATFLEQYEGMRVSFPQSLYLTDMFNLAQYGEISLSSGDRLYTPTQIVEPGAPAVAQQAANDLNRILIDDGSNMQYVEPTAFLPPGGTLRLGWTTTNLTGVLSYGFNSYRLQPDTNYPTWDSSPNPRPTSAPDVGGNVQVVSFNVLNYFNGDGMGGGFPTSRGAESFEQFQRQRAKLLSALIELDADIYSLIEIENDGFGANSAIQDIVNGLNDYYGAGVFAAADPGIGTIGTDVITLAQVYRTDVVTAVGAALVDLDSVNSRPTFAQTYSVNANGGVFSVVGNHFKSKGCGDATGADTDQLDGQSCYNARRIQQANRLLTFIDTTVIPTSGDPDVLIVGDLNSYFYEDPIDVLLAAGIENLIDDPYSISYLFQRQSGALDYAMATASLAAQVTGAEKWHINADEPPFFDYDDNFEATYHYTPGLEVGTPYWTADHDPVVVGLDIAGAAAMDIIIDRTNAALVTDAAGDVTAVAEGATIGDQFCVLLPDDPVTDVTVNLSIDPAFTGEIDLLNSSMVNVGKSHSIVIPGAADATICNSNQIVGVTAINDSAVEGEDELTDAIEISASGYTMVYETVWVYDAGATITEVPLMQEGATDTYTVVLTAPPGIRAVNPGGAFEMVTIQIAGFNTRLLTISPTTLQFTRANWDVPQVVTATAVEDEVDRGSRYNNSVAHSFSSNIAPQNSMYGGAAPNLAAIRIRFDIVDNDQIAGQTHSQEYYDALNLAAWLDIAPSNTPVLEGAAGGGLGVRLAGQPVENEVVIVNLASLPGVTLSPSTLTFTQHNWNVYQSVTVTVASDGVEQGVYSVTVQVAITSDSTAVEFIGAVDATSVPVADIAVAVPPAAELPAAPFVPAPEATTTDEGSVSE